MKRTLVNLFVVLAFSCKTQDNFKLSGKVNLEPKSAGKVITHTYYSLPYSESDEQAYWVFYHLTPTLIEGPQGRTDDFRADPAISTGSASLGDYKRSGYDRGHLCPAADMKLSQTSMSESFFLSNMSPQKPSFNRGIWSKLESRVRMWALEYDELYVATGGVLTAFIDTIGTNRVTVPEKYYKVLYSEKNGMIAFVLPNEDSQLRLSDVALTVDSVEVLTGIDFFPGLEDKLEKQLEMELNLLIWGF